MSRIRSVKISGFRRLVNLELPLADHPLMVMIGANGVGKTSLLDAFSLLAASADGKFNLFLNDLGGIVNLLTHKKTDALILSVDMDIPNYEPLKYFLSIIPKGQSYFINAERLTQSRLSSGYPDPFLHIDSSNGDIRYYDVGKKQLTPPNWEYNFLETSLSQVPKMFKQPEDLRRMLCSSTLYHFLNVGPRAPIKLPQPMKPARLPGKNGEDIIPFLYNLRETDPDRFETLEDTLRAAFPSFVRLNFPSVAAGMMTMTWKDEKYTDPFYMHQLSEGILRFLWLVSLLQSPELSTVTMIDEPEVSLHPELLNLLSELMREASQRTQLIVATHSDRLE